MTSPSCVLRKFQSIDSMDEEVWGRLTAPDFPFGDHAFLRALESSRVVGAAAGWDPQLLTLWRAGRCEGATVLYAKDHSYGEYIFDWSWAEAYHRNGVSYYPKLVAASPFTPATGPKLLLAPPSDHEAVAARLLGEAKNLTVELEASSLHYLFLTERELPYFEAAGFLIRHSFQYHWENRGYRDFTDFLAALKPKKRKQILRERAQLSAENISTRIVTGSDLTEAHADLFYEFYLNTIRGKNAIPYLNRDFFSTVFTTMRDNVMLILAEEKDQPIAGALYYRKGSHLYGRYWGAIKDVRHLHFELCYYQPIVWAITHGLTRFEAGAQGEHKVARGFLPRLTYSAHWIRHPDFHRAIAAFIDDEAAQIRRFFADRNAHSPFK